MFLTCNHTVVSSQEGRPHSELAVWTVGLLFGFMRLFNQLLDHFCRQLCRAVIRSLRRLVFGVDLGHICSLECLSGSALYVDVLE